MTKEPCLPSMHRVVKCVCGCDCRATHQKRVIEWDNTPNSLPHECLCERDDRGRKRSKSPVTPTPVRIEVDRRRYSVRRFHGKPRY